MSVDKGMWCWYDDAAFDRKVIARCEALDD